MIDYPKDISVAFKKAYEYQPAFSPGKDKKISFAERAALRKASMPPVGSYDTDKAYKIMSFCSNSITARKRS